MSDLISMTTSRPANRALQAGGAECAVLCTNTMHKVAGAIESAISIPFLHIADPVGEASKARGWRRKPIIQ